MARSSLVLVYDDDCGFCQAAVRWLKRRDRVGRLVAVPCQAPDLAALAPGVPRHECERAVQLVAPNGQRRAGARAIFGALAQLPGFWGWVGRTLSPAAWLFEPGYRLIARYRHRLSAWLGLEACRFDNTGER